jgi:hypothetical protein
MVYWVKIKAGGIVDEKTAFKVKYLASTLSKEAGVEIGTLSEYGHSFQD